MSLYKTRRDLLRYAALAPFANLSPYQAPESQGKPKEKTTTFVGPIQERIRLGLLQGETTGLAVAVVYGNGILYEDGFGWADRERGRKVTPHSPFSLQSVTKPFSTTLVTTFAAEGRLSIDEPANRYLKTARLQGPNGDPENVTVRLLGAHASGLPGTYQELYGGLPSPRFDDFLKNYGRLAYPPGTIWEYSNIGFEALGAIVKDLTQADYGNLMSHRVLAPLEMKNSFWDTDAARVPEGVIRYDPSGKPIPFYVTTTPPSGELFASAHDLARFTMWNMKMRLENGSTLLNEGWVDELHKPVFIGPTGAASTFGWALDRLASGETVVHKGGGGAGVSTIVCMVPERKLACIVLANHQFAQNLIFGVCDEVMKTYLPAWKMPGENGEPPKSPFAVSSQTAGAWKGTLINDGVVLPIRLTVKSSNDVTLSLGEHPPEKVTDLQTEGHALLGLAFSIVDAPEARRIGTNAVRLKLLPTEDRLLGRLTAQSGPIQRPQATLSFIVALTRAT